MRLQSVKIFNFRSLEETSWLGVYDLTAFIGENDGGKTACTEAVHLLLEKTARPDEEDFRLEVTDAGEPERSDTITIEAVLECGEEERALVYDATGFETNMLHIKRRFHRDRASELVVRGPVTQHEEFLGDWPKYTVDRLRELSEKYGIELDGVKLKQDTVDRISAWLAEQPTVDGEKELPGAFFELMPRFEVFSSSEADDPEQVVNNVLRTLCREEINSDKYSGQIQEIEEGISEALSEKVSELTPYIQRHYSEVDETIVEPRFNIDSGLERVPLQLSKQGGGPIHLQKKGEGKKRQVALGVYEWGSEALRESVENDVVLVLDEPDTHMDYHSQRRLFDIISSYADSSIQVVICTHSLNLINRMPAEKIHHFQLDDAGCTNTESLPAGRTEEESEFINNIGLSLGLDTGTIFHERCFLIVEGDTEMQALPLLFKTLFGETLQSAGVRPVKGDGNTGIKKFAQFLREHNRNVIFLLDEDCRNEDSRKTFSPDQLSKDGFQVDKDVFFVGDQEFEDAFDDSVLVEVANKYHAKEDGTSWQESEFAELRADSKKFSDALQRVLRCGKPEIGNEIGQIIDSSGKVPEQIVAVLNQARERANLRGGVTRTSERSAS